MKTKKARKIITIPALLLTLLLWQGCSDYQQCKRIETGPVDITIYPNSTEFQDLNVVNGYVHLTSRPPSKGIIVYRYSQDQFKAYERSCPHAPDNPDAVVTVEEDNGMVATDSVCGTRFLLIDGSPFEGPESCPLTEYRTDYDGFRLRIYY
jgi:nitrite reductase/ring-hydroxylating ferredoxin subunit